MIAAIHQPNFIPWIGYFYKMIKCHRFVFLDDVQYVRRGYTNRAKIKTPEGEKWLTVPVIKKGRYHQAVLEVELEPGDRWKKKILGNLHANYGKAPYFQTYFPALEDIVKREYAYLAGMNMELIRWMAGVFEIAVPLMKASELEGVSGQASDRLASICKAIGADRYLSGFGGQKYQEEEIFHQYGIRLEVYDFLHPTYSQLWGDFIPGLSSLDFIFNCGPLCSKILRSQAER